MIGTLLNFATIVVGGALGVLLGSRFSPNLRETVMRGLGLVTLILGIQMGLQTASIMIVLGSLLVGGLIGELLNIEGRLARLGGWLEARLSRVRAAKAPAEGAGSSAAEGSARFVRGFVAASLLFCTGPMAILGSFQDGLSGDFRLLAIKAAMDGFATLALASTLGIGAAFSALPVLVYQGSLSLLAGLASNLLTPPMITEITATGGVMLIALSLSVLLEIKPIRVGNFLPALVIAPLIVWVVSLF
jgi:uncharacterized protein